jgi:UDP-3-O-[3-hydroxymyristoyl] glucosamine N-acyltransferase
MYEIAICINALCFDYKKRKFQMNNKKIKNLIIVDDAYLSFNTLLNRFSKSKLSHFGIHIDSRIHESVQLGNNVSVGQFSVIGPNCNIGNNVIILDNVSIQENVTIGDDCVLYSGARIYDDTFIGNQCIFHSNCVIGSDGFGFAPNEVGEYIKTPQLGNVKIGNKVEIGSNSSIDRATLGSTIISDGVKIDNLVQIAHNVYIGKNTVIAGQCGIAGSTKVGENCQIGGQVGISGHITIGNNVKINGGSGVYSSVKDDSILKGTPAMNQSDFNRSYVYFRNFQQIVNEINSLKKINDNKN